MMLVVYFRNDNADFREQGFSLQMISATHEDWSKSTNSQYHCLKAKIEKSKTTIFSQTFEVADSKVPLFSSFLASKPSY